MSTHYPLTEIHALFIEVALEAGHLITTAHPSTSSSDTKLNSADLVTETDKAVEDHVISRLTAHYPACSFLGEETYKPGTRLTDAPTFICDPIDGTTNFVHGFPYACISLAFAEKKVPLVGVIFNPFTGALYHGIRGQGSFVRHVSGQSHGSDQRLPLRQAPLGALDTALVGVEWGSEREGNNWTVKTDLFSKLAGSTSQGGKMVHSLRSLGSAELNLCNVAAGALDAYWEGGCWAWDVAAGWVILEEAGGKIVGGNPGDWNPEVDGRKYLAVRGAENGEGAQRAFVEEFWGCLGEGRLEYTL